MREFLFKSSGYAGYLKWYFLVYQKIFSNISLSSWTPSQASKIYWLRSRLRLFFRVRLKLLNTCSYTRRGIVYCLTIGVHYEKFLAQQVSEGRFGSVSEAIRAGLRLLEERETKLSLLRRALIEGEQSGTSDYSLKGLIEGIDGEGLTLFLTLAEIIEIHKDQITRYGGMR